VPIDTQYYSVILNSLNYRKDFSTCPHWTTTTRKTKEKMVEHRNRPLGLILEWKMMIERIRIVQRMVMYVSLRNSNKELCYSRRENYL
jgi:hypothetical protein